MAEGGASSKSPVWFRLVRLRVSVFGKVFVLLLKVRPQPLHLSYLRQDIGRLDLFGVHNLDKVL